MIRTFALLVAFVAAFGTIGLAQNMRYFGAANVRNPRVLAGQVNGNGTVARGSHFTSQLVSTGVYQVTFDPGYFRNGCPMLTVSNFSNGPAQVVNEVYQDKCSGTYTVHFYTAAGQHFNQAFTFVAASTE